MADNCLEFSSPPSFVQKNISLASYNAFRFDYKAQYFATINTLKLLKEAIQWARSVDIPVTIIGSGSNLLICDGVFGLVLINRLIGKTIISEFEESICLRVSAGENWHKLVAYSVANHWYGIENLALIPGTVGAAPVQNIGAYGVEVKDVLTRLQVFDVITDELNWLKASECGFTYRNSLFKGDWQGKYIITAIEILLNRSPTFLLNYGTLSQSIEGEITLYKVFDAICHVRSSKLPDPLKLANAGSFFKNPVVNAKQHDKLKNQFPNLVSYVFEKGYKLAAGWLIEQAGWKGAIHRGVGVYDKQALVLVSYSENKADALLELEDLIKQSVLKKYGVFLERELVKLPMINSTTNLSKDDTK